MKINKRTKLLNLIRKYLNGTADSKEEEFVEEYYRFFDQKEAPSAHLSKEKKQEIEERMSENIQKEIAPKPKKSVTLILKKTYKKVGVAVAIIFLMVGLSYWFIRPHNDLNPRNNTAQIHDIYPGGSKALLTLADGSTIKLNSAQKGILFKHGNMQIIKADSGQILYQYKQVKTRKEIKNHKETYNILTTPASGSYQVVLPDGSKVWLNASSSLKFPTTFREEIRKVKVRGEAYFEVKGDETHPFVVQIEASDGKNMGSVKVLGTHFNINAYMDDRVVKTTLIEGKIKVLKGTSQELLYPGEQATTKRKEDQIEVAKVNSNEAIAWKNGFFQFEDADIVHIMNKISRWYNVDVTYKNQPKGHYSGVISRQTKLSEVLKILETGGFHFKVKDRKIIVNP